MADHVDQPDRIERERDFHDQRFSDDSARAAAGKFYDLVAGAYASYRSTLSEVTAGAQALEFGAGIGGDGFDLAARGVRLTAIDISPVAVEHANEAARRAGLAEEACRFVVMNAETLEFDDDSFDLVFGSGILHHLNLDAAFSEITRVLKPGGTALFFEPMGHNPAINLYRRLTPAMRSPDEHPLTTTDLDRALRWFGSVEREYHVLLSFAALPFRSIRRYPALVAKLNAWDARVLQRFNGLGRMGWIVVLRLRA